jgi:hypothetical protein
MICSTPQRFPVFALTVQSRTKSHAYTVFEGTPPRRSHRIPVRFSAVHPPNPLKSSISPDAYPTKQSAPHRCIISHSSQSIHPQPPKEPLPPINPDSHLEKTNAHPDSIQTKTVVFDDSIASPSQRDTSNFQSSPLAHPQPNFARHNTNQARSTEIVFADLQPILCFSHPFPHNPTSENPVNTPRAVSASPPQIPPT